MIPAKWTERNTLSTYKSDYSFRRNVYGEADWAWVRNWVKKQKKTESSYAQGLMLCIEVTVWPENHKPADRKLFRSFEAGELRQAKRYARELVEQGKSVMSEVRGVLFAPYEGYKTIVDWGEYEPAEEER